MNGAPAKIRPETEADAPAVRALLEAAFPGPAEADLVDRLRASGDLVLALVSEQHGKLAGYIAFPRLSVEHETGVIAAVGLAPVAVEPALQRRGIGSGLIHEGLARLAKAGECIVFVLGDAGYYGRFGFQPSDDFESRYRGPHFQVLRLAPSAPRSGAVTYPGAFADLS